MKLDFESIVGILLFLFVIGFLTVCYSGSVHQHECRLKAIEKGLQAVEIQAICK